jgi:hypothetical protein
MIVSSHLAGNDHHSAMAPIMDSLDHGRIAFGDRDEVPLATEVDPVCGRRLRCADAVSAIDYQGAPIFFLHGLSRALRCPSRSVRYEGSDTTTID